MVQQIISVGTSPNDGTGDPLRTAMVKINQNFTEIYGRDAAGSNFDLTENTISAINTNGNIALVPSGTGSVILGSLRFPNTDGTAGQVLITNGSNVLAWSTNTPVAAGVTGSVQIRNLAGSIDYAAGFTYDTAASQLATSNLSVVTITTPNTNQNLTLDPNGTGRVMLTGNATVTQNLLVTGNANISADANIAGNANVAGNVTVTGTLTANNINLSNVSVSSISDGTSNVQVAASGNVSVSVAGTSNVVVFTTTGINIPLSGKIKGDFSNATPSSRSAFQSSTTNGQTSIYAIPAGSNNFSSWQALNNSDPTNASKIMILANVTTDMQLVSGRNGSGTYLPLSVWTNNTEQITVGTDGNVNFAGSANVTGNLSVTANANVTGNINITANANVTGNLSVTANANVTGNLSVTANANVTGNIYQNGNLVPNLVTMMTYNLAF